MTVTTEQIRGALNEMAEAGTAPDPTALLAGAGKEVARLKRRRQARWLGAAAAAVVAIGGASLLITDLGGDTQGEVAPAKPDNVDGTQRAGDDGPPEYLDGLIVVATYDVTPVDTRTEEDELVVPAPASDWSTQVYALSWCDSADGSGAMVLVDDEVAVGAPCADTSGSSTQAEPLPRGAEHYLLTVTDEPTTVALYVEHTSDSYPFPDARVIPQSTPPEGPGVIDDSMPRGLDPILQVLPPWRQVRSVTVPLTDEPLTIDARLDGPGQLLVAVDGVVVTNDGEYLYDPPRTGPWREADPHLVDGYLQSFGAPASHFSSLNRAAMEQLGIVASDGEVTISVDAQKVHDAQGWRVVVGQSP